MAGSRARRMNIPLRGVALVCALMMFALLANVTLIQAFQADTLREDPRNLRTQIARFDRPRGELLTRDGTVIAVSERARGRFDYHRSYPHGPLYAPVTGHLSLYGPTGMERAEDGILGGDDPRLKVRALVENGTIEAASLKLTIDARAQEAAYAGLRATGRRGAVVALDPLSGAILALVSFPSYDPNRYTTFNVTELNRVDAALRRDPARPLLNRALNQNYPPGSTFKVITSAAAIGSGGYSARTKVDAPTTLRLPGTGVVLKNANGVRCANGRPQLAYAFMVSCNTAFAGIGLRLGQDLLREQAERFGFGVDDLRVPLPVSASVYPEVMDRAQTAMSAIGQFDARATPLGIAMISAAVANSGLLMRPYLVEQVRMSDGTVLEQASPSPYMRTMSSRVAAQLTGMMINVTQLGGTGRAAAIPGVHVAAKTGTAENVSGAESHAVITAFAPAEHPLVAVGVLVEQGGHGGDVAAPIARAVMRAVLSG
ncbi:peptidoglycan D,D-transpeptidase FtsI family protein [Streptosporangium sp. KLBMP 9127]|nr:penicillin-binding protein 2 [Streptosporangium sp. KLBMP 9127]